VLFRLSAFLAGLVLLGSAEVVWPRRRRALARRDRWTGNLGLVVVAAILVRLVAPGAAVGVAGLAEARGWGLLHAIGPAPAWFSLAASVVGLDLAIYAQHVLFHTVPALWALHRVHHTDPELDVTTGVRFHPVEILLSVGVKAGTVGILGAPVVAVIVFEIVLNAGSLWSHANLRLPEAADRALRMVLVTPDMHRVHHSAEPAERDHNFGFTLPWWDRLFGTYRARPRAGHQAMELGVAGFDVRAVLALRALLLQPLLGGPESRQNAPPSSADAGVPAGARGGCSARAHASPHHPA
jgi:sterol desaturase/sphingolipid hydroxylase (fatty acid hydroxylase superfamily)